MEDFFSGPSVLPAWTLTVLTSGLHPTMMARASLPELQNHKSSSMFGWSQQHLNIWGR
ncbi:hypothetical protein EXN66_Car021054 [Channa argus]|uniref:Uncharacterized protein n=1 Tax=Channa argus TaxID=215402 RepID=A0A6G1QST8_CHAAH|nr:hypothetical protein EXN66_Car021054 [Channa argus]